MEVLALLGLDHKASVHIFSDEHVIEDCYIGERLRPHSVLKHDWHASTGGQHHVRRIRRAL